MALVEIYHVVAASRAVASGQTIKEGQIVALNTSGQVVLQGNANPTPYGIAGDTKSTTASSMPGIYAGWQNRASDYFDETSASGRMTVYHSGGEFATDQFDSNVANATPYTALYATGGDLKQHDDDATGVIVAYLLTSAGSYPSGVPGVDINGDMALRGEESNTYIEIKLVI